MIRTHNNSASAEALRRYALFLNAKTDKQRAHNYTRFRKYLEGLGVPVYEQASVEIELSGFVQAVQAMLDAYT